ncbi:DUF2510 domain-containing protein [Arthrobacter sp. M4]|uniref:DUF2510 domain-containing protein n=1 Tax=Arthrobacter sp. M4 TaxID=218160 RepID=UPI001CDD7007|nr:DUF2510 domain-containing protein [Arthrobacter sp. M4]MCA4133017.1 DUF2510 domain-containing protein [Arthrobacter sp. M4]
MFLPLVSIVLFLFWNPTFRVIYIGPRSTPTLDPASWLSPVYFLLLLSSFLVYGGSVLLAFLDYQKLERDGVVRPFHWAWSFLNATVYIVGRSIIVHKVAKNRGLVPIWVLIGVVVLSAIVTSVKMTAMFSSIISTYQQ